MQSSPPNDVRGTDGMTGMPLRYLGMHTRALLSKGFWH